MCVHLCITVLCNQGPKHHLAPMKAEALPCLLILTPILPLQFLNSSPKVFSGQRAEWEAAVNPDPLPRGALVTAGWLLSTGEGRNRANKRKENGNTFPGPRGCASYQYKFHTKVLSGSALQGARGTFCSTKAPESSSLGSMVGGQERVPIHP